ncbi:MAG: glycerol-3-phosphate dehydrogenase/oxidase [Acidimicrobiales bacterium]
MRQSSTLSPERRQADIARLTGTPLDVLVVGGGVTGAGTALDAASRGLSVGLVEAQDWAAGTSSRSSKLVHGGLRYLQMLDFRLVREALRERSLLIQHLAPHLVRPVPVLYPLRRPFFERPYVGAGVALYDILGLATGSGRGLPLHRHLSKRHALASAPGLDPRALSGAVLYYDAQVDDARYVVELVRTAVSYGAVAVSRATVVGFRHDNGRVGGVTVQDAETGRQHQVQARVTVLATGAWTEETEALAGVERTVRIRPSKGAHLLVKREKLDVTTALILRTDRSVLFVLPWGEHWLIGTTDTDWSYGKARPLATVADVDYLLSELNKVVARPLARPDVEAVFAGLRPLVAGSGVVRGPGEGRAGAGRGAATTKLSREHAVSRPAPGLVVVSGGKYTTYRVMAADAIDAVVAEAQFQVPRSRTATVPLLAAGAFREMWEGRHDFARHHGVSVEQAEHLLRRYGGLATEVIGLTASRPLLAGPVPGASRYLKAEVEYSVTHEGALHLEDVLARRTRIAMETPNGGVASAVAVAGIMGPLLGWDDARETAEVADYSRQAQLVGRSATTAQDDAEAAHLAEAVPTLLPLP